MARMAGDGSVGGRMDCVSEIIQKKRADAPLGMRSWFAIAVCAAALSAVPAHAQVQRTFVNLGFEQPALTGSSCYLIFSATAVNGWTTSHSNNAVGGTCSLAGQTPGAIVTQPVEFWRGPSFNGVPPRAGMQHAELNAYESSRLSQTICLTAGEQIDWSLSHRGRNSDTAADQMNFNIDSTANTVGILSSTTNGGGGAPSCADSGSVDNVSCTVAATATNGWRDYSGRFIWNGTTGNHSFGFQSLNAGGSGNFLDEIQVTLRPYVEFSSATYTTREGQTIVVPQIRVLGTVPASGITVLATITGGTAARPGDYTTASGTATVNISVPQGVYDNNLFSVPIASIVNDAVIENNETVTLQLQPSVANYTLASGSTCGGTPITAATLTILDNDVDLLTTKSVNTATPAPGGTAVFTVAYQNNTAQPTAGSGSDLAVHDATVQLVDALPAGFTAFSWTCVASGTPAPVCPAASGTGPINTPATLPAGNSGAAGGTLIYTITGTLAATQCASTTNTSTVTATGAVAEGTSAQAGFPTPAPGGTGNNTATAAVDPLCADLSITKTNNATSVTSGTVTTYDIVVSNAGPDAISNANLTDPVPTNLINCALGAPACAVSSGTATCPTVGAGAGQLSIANLQGGGVLIPSMNAASSLTFKIACTVN